MGWTEQRTFLTGDFIADSWVSCKLILSGEHSWGYVRLTMNPAMIELAGGKEN